MIEKLLKRFVNENKKNIALEKRSKIVAQRVKEKELKIQQWIARHDRKVAQQEKAKSGEKLQKYLQEESLKKTKYLVKQKYKILNIKRDYKYFWSTVDYLQAKYQNKIDFEKLEKNVQYRIFKDGTRKKIVADIENIYLSFGNPARPNEKNIVLRGPSIEFYEGEVHAIIGESGSGKSVITSLLYGLTGTNAIIESGKVRLFNVEVQDFNSKDWEKSKYRGVVVSAVFQNPMSTLNPTMKVGKQIVEGMIVNKLVSSPKEAYEKALEYLRLTKINNPEKVMNLYPHELSGGMIQRAVIAAIVSMQPRILVMDEPTTALDPTVQALVLDIIRDLQQKFKITIIFITHDLGVVASISQNIAIMYAGQIIETGTRDEILENPQHPYTWGLILSMPDVNQGNKLTTIRGSVPSSLNKIVGDAFAPRNDYALARDFEVEPDFYKISETHFVKSALLDPKAEKVQPPKLILDKWTKWKKMQQKNKKR